MTKLHGMLGLAKRAGKVSTGAFICEKMIKQKAARLVVLATDASDNTKKTITDCCTHNGIELITASTMSELGHCVGAGADRAVVSVNDNNFATAILDIYKTSIQKEKG